ncbi:tRNA modification GTPase trmE [Thermosipho atlanticus DSM 15807]|uniref:tRNA modification GTPase MnmE n=1 Tax=Thermosipho atlanticus DSM 15807 TaxID=1123380 RepID=A0A1M5QSC9_9BACT|nr:tRNA modification GTPase trmE [Thermosipho atlanticus DSM 15807]
MQDTIAAISTPKGTGAIAVIRIDGEKSHEIAKKLTKLDKIEYRRVYYTTLWYNNEILDDVNIVFYKTPNSYTGNDLVEIYCHGGILITHKVLDVILNSGARLAERGEFTKRAFLNGKLSLIQAEAIYQIIEAKSELSLKISLENLKGRLGEEIKSYREKLMRILAEIEVSIDYPDDIDSDIDMILKGLNEIYETIKEKVEKSKKGLHLSSGIILTIVGKPNSGKSTLLNRLLYEDRAIVTDVPGTTRDVIKGEIDIKGVHFIIADTAGIRKTDDMIEKIGIERSLKEIKKSDLILFVLDASTGFTNEDEYIYEKIKDYNFIPVWNKCDLGKKIERFQKESVQISALSGEGLRNLEDKILDKVKNIIENGESSHVTTQRQLEILERVKMYIKSALDNFDFGYELDIISIDIRKALEELDLLSGKKFSEDLLDTIFSNFCVGK